jgi:hypothetical protein
MTAALAIVTGLDNYSATNARIGDYTMLDSGVTRAVVMEYRPSQHGVSGGRAVQQMFQNQHNILVRVFYEYVQDGTTYTNLLSEVDTIMAEFAKYPKNLNDTTTTITRAVIQSSGDVFAMFQGTSTSPYFLRMDLFLEVIEDVSR